MLRSRVCCRKVQGRSFEIRSVFVHGFYVRGDVEVWIANGFAESSAGRLDLVFLPYWTCVSGFGKSKCSMKHRVSSNDGGNLRQYNQHARIASVESTRTVFEWESYWGSSGMRQDSIDDSIVPTTRARHLVHGDRDRRIRLHQVCGAVLATICIAVIMLLAIGDAKHFVILVCGLFSLFAFVMSASFLVTLMYAKRDGGREDELTLQAPDGPDRESIAVLIPARHETNVLAATLLNTAWTQRDHTHHQIFAVINDDDLETMRVAAVSAITINELMDVGASRETIDREILTAIRDLNPTEHVFDLLAAIPDGPVQVLVYPLGDRPPNKPQQLNFAFWYLRSSFSIFTVLDAESLAAKGLLRTVDRAFSDNPDVQIIQGGIQLMDPVRDGSWWRRAWTGVSRWYAWHNLLEYTRWFSSQMRYQSDRGFMPLGGNTVFLRRELLSKTDAWPMSLTEDCELGVRATAIHRAKTLSFYDPILTTREETPPNIKTLIKQRRRWNIGFIQSFMAGNWRALPTVRQRFVALWILSMCLFQTISLVILPLTLLTIFWIKSPAPLAVALCVPTIPVVLGMVLQMLYLHEYGRSFDRRIGWHVYVVYIVTFLPYQLVLSFAASQALVWYLQGRLGWDKTAHTGDHFNSALTDSAVPTVAAVA